MKLIKFLSLFFIQHLFAFQEKEGLILDSLFPQILNRNRLREFLGFRSYNDMKDDTNNTNVPFLNQDTTNNSTEFLSNNTNDSTVNTSAGSFTRTLKEQSNNNNSNESYTNISQEQIGNSLEEQTRGSSYNPYIQEALSCTDNQFYNPEEKNCNFCDKKCLTCSGASEDKCIICELPRMKSKTKCVSSFSLVIDSIEEIVYSDNSLKPYIWVLLYAKNETEPRSYFSNYKVLNTPKNSLNLHFIVADHWEVAKESHLSRIDRLKVKMFNYDSSTKSFDSDKLLGEAESSARLLESSEPGKNVFSLQLKNANGDLAGLVNFKLELYL